MSAPSPAPQRRPFDLAAWRPSKRSLLYVVAAFGIGLVLFAWVWSGSRTDGSDFYRADTGASPTSESPNYAPLPAPKPAAPDGTPTAADTSAPPASQTPPDERPQLVETTPPPPPHTGPAAPTTPTAASVATSQPQPIPGENPAPRYPPQALRRGESGTVTLRAEIGPDGVPISVNIANGSGSRILDRAAADSVRRWRFRPAMANGQPTHGTVMIPVTFDANR